MNRKEAVLEVLRNPRGSYLSYYGVRDQFARAKGYRDGWVNGHVLTRDVTGGTEGLRRLRELRADGHRIEMRPHPDAGRTTRQYRLAP